MRSAAMLFGGLVLIGLGVGAVLAELPGRWVIGPVLVVLGLAVKVAGFLVTEDPGRDPAPRPGERRPMTLGGEVCERPRLGIAAGRAPVRAGRVPGAPRPAGARLPPDHRRAS